LANDLADPRPGHAERAGDLGLRDALLHVTADRLAARLDQVGEFRFLRADLAV
jgi:hypothetical protein